jgi:phosphate transport system substrate-binding protein
MKFLRALGTLFLSLSLISCAERDKHGKVLDDPTSGNITIAVDESLRPIVEAEVNAFEKIYDQAHIQIHYLSESEAIEMLLKDSARLAVVTRRLTPEETDRLTQEKIEATQSDIATGAIALIIHKDNGDSLITTDQLRSILEGKITNWNQLNGNHASLPVELIFDNPASGMIRWLRDSIRIPDTFPSNCFGVKSNRAVVDYVSQRQNAIGLIGVEWISDDDDSTANSFLHTIQVMSVARVGEFRKPYQAYIALGQYPLCRKITLISREARAGLGTGFSAFVAGDKGQRIILKSGLVPATMPIRIVEINYDDR